MKKEVQTVTEDLVRLLWKDIKEEQIGDIPKLSYESALKFFGTDKPDLRNPLKLKPLSQETIKKSGVKIFGSRS